MLNSFVPLSPIESVSSEVPATKIFRDSQLLILHNGEFFNLHGVKVK